jgi:N-acetylmuramoyl-L-alanine amidase
MKIKYIILNCIFITLLIISSIVGILSKSKLDKFKTKEQSYIQNIEVLQNKNNKLANEITDLKTEINQLEQQLNNIKNGSLDLLAKLVHHESNNQCIEGQQAVAEAAINRVRHPRFPNTLEEVLFQPGQFMPRSELMSVRANEKNYEAVRKAFTSPILPSTYVYFATTPCNGRNHIKIQDHYFGEV